MTKHLRKAAKAYVGAVIAAAAFLAPVADDGLVTSEVLGVLGVALAAWQGIYWTSNTRAASPS